MVEMKRRKIILIVSIVVITILIGMALLNSLRHPHNGCGCIDYSTGIEIQAQETLVSNNLTIEWTFFNYYSNNASLPYPKPDANIHFHIVSSNNTEYEYIGPISDNASIAQLPYGERLTGNHTIEFKVHQQQSGLNYFWSPYNGYFCPCSDN